MARVSGVIVKPFHPWEDEAIRELVFVVSNRELAVFLGRGISGVGKRVHQLGLGWVSSVKRSRNRWYFGQAAHNKGVKMSAATYEKVKATFFKKGENPKNTGKNGDIAQRADKTGRIYQYIRVAPKNWQLLNRVIWEKHNGPLGKQDMVIFKDGNTMNCCIENLERITKRENALRNANHDNPSDARVASFMARTGTRRVDPELRDELMRNKPLLELKRNQIFLKRKLKKQQHAKD